MRLRILLPVVIVGSAACEARLVDVPWSGVNGTPTPTATVTPFDAGDGRDGSPVVSASVSLTDCHPVDSISGNLVSVTGAAIAGGDRVLLHEVQDTFATVGSPADVGDPAAAGLFEVGAVASVAPSQITLAWTPAAAFTAGASARAQVCVLRQYQDVVVQAGGAIVATPWDGTSGGVIAFFVAGTLTIESGATITAAGAGFRGGAPSGGGATSAADVTTPDDGAGKGEGLDPSALALHGRGNVANAGGGGNNHNGSGGGGGNGGAGGRGGFYSNTEAYGKGGSRVTATGRLVLGGGGGAGESHHGAPSAGAAGGGVVFLTAARLEGAGSIDASGANAVDSVSATDFCDGGGGGGAGGTIRLRVEDSSAFTGVLRAAGGNGADAFDIELQDVPGGGGGGGGRIAGDRPAGAVVDVAGGIAGISEQADSRGATAGAPGVVE